MRPPAPISALEDASCTPGAGDASSVPIRRSNYSICICTTARSTCLLSSTLYSLVHIQRLLVTLLRRERQHQGQRVRWLQHQPHLRDILGRLRWVGSKWKGGEDVERASDHVRHERMPPDVTEDATAGASKTSFRRKARKDKNTWIEGEVLLDGAASGERTGSCLRAWLNRL